MGKLEIVCFERDLFSTEVEEVVFQTYHDSPQETRSSLPLVFHKCFIPCTCILNSFRALASSEILSFQCYCKLVHKAPFS